MNSLNLQDAKLICKNVLHFYALTMNYKKKKLRKQSHLHCLKNNEVPGLPWWSSHEDSVHPKQGAQV